DQLPNDKDMQVRGIYDSEFSACQMKLGLRTATAEQVSTPEGLQAILYEFGPIWCGGYCCPDLTTKLGRGFKHIVVVRGVKTHWFDSPEVYVNDPYRGYVAQARPSWWSWSYFYANLLKVPNNCQYWS